MKRFSARSGYSTMAELNVTPMLDLAFTLLIIFIITTPLMESGIEINLPTAAPAPAVPERNTIKTVEINRQGELFFEGKRSSLNGLRDQLARLHESDPTLAVVIRADRDLRYQQLVDVFDMLQQAKITRLGLMHLDTQ